MTRASALRCNLIAALALTLAACEGPGAPPADAPAEPAPPSGAVWTYQVGGTGAALARLEDGVEQARFACRRDPADLFVVVETFRPVDSEERLTVGAGDEAYGLVADPSADRPSGVQASGPVSDAFLDALVAGGPVGVNYGFQTWGPVPGPDRPTAEAFAAACRAAAKG